jgi:hypothetical protein
MCRQQRPSQGFFVATATLANGPARAASRASQSVAGVEPFKNRTEVSEADTHWLGDSLADSCLSLAPINEGNGQSKGVGYRQKMAIWGRHTERHHHNESPFYDSSHDFEATNKRGTAIVLRQTQEGFVKPAIGECGLNCGDGRSRYSLAAPTLRCVYPVGFTACLNDVRVHSVVLEHLVVPMDRATQSVWV